MGVIGTILLVVFIIVCILLVLLVLLQNDGESGMGILGGQNTQAFGARSGNVLSKTTYILVTIFFVLIIGLALLNKAPKTSSLDAAIQEATVVEDATTPTTDYWEEELQSTTEAVEVTE